MNNDNGYAKAVHTDALASGTTLDTAGLSTTAAAPTQIVFIEGNAPDLQDLVSGLAPNATAVVLDPGQDGLQQMAAYLASHTIQNLAGIDIVAHGADGAMQLGTATLDSATIADYQAQLQQIGAALAPGGAIQLFGCDVAQDATGVSFLDQLSQATGGATIAAASHLVGDASGGGSFNLDVDTGAVTIGTPFTAAAMAAFQGELSAIDLTADGTVTYTGGGAPVTLDGSATATDMNNITSATISIDSGFVTGDTLNFSDMLGITGSYDPATGTLTLNGSATDADYQAALDTITYSFSPANGDPTDAGNAPTRTIAWSVTDDSATSATQTSTVIVQESPVLTYGTTIDETGITAASETVADGTLTLFDADNNVVGTLAVGTTLSTPDFLLSSDGSGGTDVTVSTVFGTYSSTLTLLTNPTSIAVTGNISDSSGVAVYGPGGTNWTLTNSGTVTETGSNGAAVSFASAGTPVVNTGFISASSGTGVSLGAGGSVTNQSGGTISGYSGIDVQGGVATVTNGGIIAGADVGGNAVGVYLGAGGSVFNQAGGTISVYRYGVEIMGAPGTVSNQGYIHALPRAFGRDGVYLTDGGVVINGAAGGTVSAAYIHGYSVGVNFGPGGAGTLTNYGTVSGLPGNPAVVVTTGLVINGPSGATGAQIRGDYGILISGAGTVVNYATISGGGSQGDTTAYTAVRLGGAGDISNLGSQSLISGYVGIYAEQNNTITNAGTIASNAGASGNAVIFGGGANRLIIDPGAAFIGTVNGSAATVVLAGGPTILGTANGVGTTTLELASGASAGTLNGLGGQYVGFAGITVDAGANWYLDGSNTLGSGVTLTDSGTLTVSGTLLNDGVITGASQGIVLGAGGLLTNQSDGLISSDDAGVGVAGSGAGTLVNYGSISASYGSGVSFGAGGSVTNQSGGVINAQLGGVSIHNGAGTVVNAGSIYATFGFGVYLSDGGTVTNQSGGVINAQRGVNIDNGTGTVVNAGSIAGQYVGVYLISGGTVTNLAGGSISGGNVAVLFGAGYANRLVIQPGATFSGLVDGGNLPGDFFVSTLEFGSAASAGTFSGLGSQYVNFGQVTIDSGAQWTLSGSDTLAAGATLSNAGTITGSVLNLAGAALTNQSGGLISGTYVDGVYGSGADSVVNFGSIDGGTGPAIYLKDAGSVTNQAGAQITGYYGVKLLGIGATVTNYGSIAGTASGITSYGVYLRDGGILTNGQSGTGTSTATIQGYEGVVFRSVDTTRATGTLANYGTILGTGTQGSGVLLSDGGTLVNGQSGATAALIQGRQYGVVNSGNGSGSVANYASIIATGTQFGDYGIAIQGSGSVTNLGANALIEGYGGVVVGQDGTVTNAGTIASNQGSRGTAVHFDGGNARLIDDPGAVFTGSIYGGSGGTATFELASGSSAGVVTGFGNSITNFATLVFDAGSQWTVEDSAGGLGGLTIQGFAEGDTIDVAGFTATSATFSSNELVLSDGIGDFETLDIQGTFSTSNFNIQTVDGSTEVSLQEAPSIVAGGSVTFSGGGSPITLDGSLTVTDEASPVLVSATIAIDSGFVVGDVLSFSDTDSITGSYDSTTGTLVLTGTDTVADYQAALDSITYSFAPVNGDPTDAGNATSRSVTFQVNDGTSFSDPATSTVIVQESPVLTYGTTIDETGIAAASETVADGTLTLFDADNNVVGTLAVGTTLSTPDFLLSSDGSGGTDVTVSTVFGTYSSSLTLLTNPTSIAVTGNISDSSGVAVYGPGGTNWALTNSGTIIETALYGSAVLLAAPGTGGTLVNAGFISESNGRGVVLDTGGYVTNQSGGVINAGRGVLIEDGAGTRRERGQHLRYLRLRHLHLRLRRLAGQRRFRHQPVGRHDRRHLRRLR